MKTPIVLYQRCMAKVSYLRLIRFFFKGTVVTENHSKDSQRTGTNHMESHMSLASVIATGAFQLIS